jgi:hypothetical protein
VGVVGRGRARAGGERESAGGASGGREGGDGPAQGGCNSRNKSAVVNRVLHTLHTLHTFFREKGREG